MTSSTDVWVLGIGMTKFGKRPDRDLVGLAADAVLEALTDADAVMRDIEVLASGSLFGPRALGQIVQKQVGQTGIPVYNVANACATGAAALRTVIMSIRAGEADVGLAVGAEKLSGSGLLTSAKAQEGPWSPEGRFGSIMDLEGYVGTRTTPGVFAQIGMEYLHRTGNPDAVDVFAKISEKNHANSTLNPLATYTKALSVEQIRNDPMIAYPNTRAMCSANCDGAAAAVLVSGDRLRTLSEDQQRRAVKVSASILTTDPWDPGCQVLPNVNTLTRLAARQAYDEAGLGPEDLDLVELHDCFATAELVHYDNLMLCDEGDAVGFFESGAPLRTGRLPVNVSGGLQSKGHPIAATGIANVYEIASHLRGEAGPRQIDGARVGLAHVIGLGSACGVHILERGLVR